MNLQFHDPFAADFLDEDAAPAVRPHLSLLELNTIVRAKLAATMEPSYWLTAEVSELRVASNGHCYLEFVQTDERSHTPIAKARGNIWRNTYAMLAARFEMATGARLAAGMKVLVNVNVTFHEVYGFALNIVDIDPAYTLGDAARRRREILQQLDDDGVLDLNKELPLPRPLQRIAVISAEGAAGYGDFCRQLAQSGFRFQLKLFPAVMQGDRTEQSVIAALDAIAAEADAWDVVAIIRGGGAVSDLGSFDTYLLAANVAQFPLPVFSGIGHERDDTVVDAVAHTRFKTPTAVAAFLIDCLREELELVAQLRQRLHQAADRRFAEEHHRFDRAAAAVRLAATRSSHHQRDLLAAFAARLTRAVGAAVRTEQRHLSPFPVRLAAATQRKLQSETAALSRLVERLPALPEHRLTNERHRLALIGQSLRMLNPERILALGYSITLLNGRPVRRADELKPGDVVTTRFERGEATAVVKHTETPEPNNSLEDNG